MRPSFIQLTVITLTVWQTATAFAAEDKSIVREIDIREKPDNDNLAIAFCARGPLSVKDRSLFGHAFIALYVDDAAREVCTAKALGFFPKLDAVSDQIESYFRFVPAKLSDDIVKNRGKTGGECVVLVRVDKTQYARAKLVIELWGDQPYSRYKLRERDCVTLAQKVADTLGLKVPDRGKLDLPVEYIRKIASENP